MRAIEQVVDDAMGKVHAKVSSFTGHTRVLSKRLDTIIMDLKKKTYIKMNEHLLNESEDEVADTDDAASVDSKVNSIANKLSRESKILDTINSKEKQT